jgi:pectate lyase
MAVVLYALTLFSLSPSVFAADGYANVGGTTTGGAGGTTVTVSDATAFKTALNSSGSSIIRVSGNISISVFVITGATNKTIEGVNTSSGWNGNIQFKGCSNLIIQHLNISSPSNGDGITLQDASHNIWVDHCTFGNCSDGMLDITHGSDNITVSWCKFAYTSAQTAHRFSNLIGHDDANAAEDTGKLHITMHHNWWSTLCDQRMPRLRFGRIHHYNNYLSCSGNYYCVTAAINSEMRIQNNYFENVGNPWSAEGGGKINASGNTLVNTTGSATPTGDTVFTPPYSFTLETAAAAKTSVMAGAGNTAASTYPAVGTWKLRSRTADKMLDSLGITTNSSNCSFYSSGTSNNQRWVLSYPSTGVAKLACVTGGIYLDSLGRTGSGSFAGLYANNTTNNQRWTLIDVGGGYWKLKNLNTGLCLDVGASPWTNGDAVEMWPDGSSQNQHWQFVAP